MSTTAPSSFFSSKASRILAFRISFRGLLPSVPLDREVGGREEELLAKAAKSGKTTSRRASGLMGGRGAEARLDFAG